MSDGFAAMLDRAQVFYRDLAANNSRDWFEPRKAGWKRDVEGPAKLLASLMAEEVTRLTGEAHGGKVFRINRDVRFSKDKAPYKTSLSMLWAPAEGPAPSVYFAVEPEDVILGVGMPSVDKEALGRWRGFADRRGAEVEAAVREAGLRWGAFGAEPLKRVPKPFDAAHPHADLLRLRALVLLGGLPEGWRERGGLLDALAEGVERMLPARAVMTEALRP